MNTRDLQAFAAVVETGSIVRAAAQLHLTQPGVTRRIQNLETLLDVALLDRQSKPLKPTAAGQEVYELGRRVLRSVGDLMALSRRDAEPVGELRLGVPPFLSELALEQPVDALRAAFPRLTLRITANWSPGLLTLLERQAIDTAAVLLADTAPPPEGLSAHRLAHQPTRVIAAAQSDVPTRATLTELAAYPWVLNQDGCGMRSALRHALDAARLPFHVAVEAFGSELQLSLVRRGLGLGVVTPHVLARSAHRDALRTIDTPDFDAGVTAWLLHPPLPPRLERPVAQLLASLRQVLGGEVNAPDEAGMPSPR